MLEYGGLEAKKCSESRQPREMLSKGRTHPGAMPRNQEVGISPSLGSHLSWSLRSSLCFLSLLSVTASVHKPKSHYLEEMWPVVLSH